MQALSEIGHTHWLVLTDAGFPRPSRAQFIDLSIGVNLPTVPQLLRLILEVCPMEAAIMSADAHRVSPAFVEEAQALLRPITIEAVAHDRFKELSQEAVLAVRTGDQHAYSNLLLRGGVSYPY